MNNNREYIEMREKLNKKDNTNRHLLLRFAINKMEKANSSYEHQIVGNSELY